MIALSLGLKAIHLAPALRVANMLLKEYTHDTWACREELHDVLLEISQKDPAWFAEFIQAGRKINSKLLQELLS